MITFLGLICDSRHPSIRSKSVDLTSNLSSKIPSREEANTANLDIHVISDCNHDNFKRQVQISFLPWCKSLIGCTIKGLSLVLESIPASDSRAVLPNLSMPYLISQYCKFKALVVTVLKYHFRMLKWHKYQDTFFWVCLTNSFTRDSQSLPPRHTLWYPGQNAPLTEV